MIVAELVRYTYGALVAADRENVMLGGKRERVPALTKTHTSCERKRVRRVCRPTNEWSVKEGEGASNQMEVSGY